MQTSKTHNGAYRMAAQHYSKINTTLCNVQNMWKYHMQTEHADTYSADQLHCFVLQQLFLWLLH